MAERGIDLAHTTFLIWVQRYVPEFEKKWNCYARPVGSSIDHYITDYSSSFRYLHYNH